MKFNIFFQMYRLRSGADRFSLGEILTVLDLIEEAVDIVIFVKNMTKKNLKISDYIDVEDPLMDHKLPTGASVDVRIDNMKTFKEALSKINTDKEKILYISDIRLTTNDMRLHCDKFHWEIHCKDLTNMTIINAVSTKRAIIHINC